MCLYYLIKNAYIYMYIYIYIKVSWKIGMMTQMISWMWPSDEKPHQLKIRRHYTNISVNDIPPQPHIYIYIYIYIYVCVCVCVCVTLNYFKLCIQSSVFMNKERVIFALTWYIHSYCCFCCFCCCEIWESFNKYGDFFKNRIIKKISILVSSTLFGIDLKQKLFKSRWNIYFDRIKMEDKSNRVH